MASDPCTVTTPVFRASYPHLFNPRKNDLNGKEEYSVTAFFEPGENLSLLQNAMDAAIKKKCGDKIPPKWRNPLKDQGEKEVNGKMPEGMNKGAMMIVFKADAAKTKPTLVDQNVQPLIEPSKIYGGCYMRANVTAYFYDQGGNKGVSFFLNHSQLVRDGQPLSGRPQVSDAFEPIADATTALDVFK